MARRHRMWAQLLRPFKPSSRVALLVETHRDSVTIHQRYSGAGR